MCVHAWVSVFVGMCAIYKLKCVFVCVCVGAVRLHFNAHNEVLFQFTVRSMYKRMKMWTNLLHLGKKEASSGMNGESKRL